MFLLGKNYMNETPEEGYPSKGLEETFKSLTFQVKLLHFHHNLQSARKRDLIQLSTN